MTFDMKNFTQNLFLNLEKYLKKRSLNHQVETLRKNKKFTISVWFLFSKAFFIKIKSFDFPPWFSNNFFFWFLVNWFWNQPKNILILLLAKQQNSPAYKRTSVDLYGMYISRVKKTNFFFLLVFYTIQIESFF